MSRKVRHIWGSDSNDYHKGYADGMKAAFEESTLSSDEESELPDKPDDGKKKRYYKKDQPKEDLPMKRPLLPRIV